MSPSIVARNRPSGCDRHHKNAFYLGSHFEWRMPVDDENTLSVAWFFVRVPKEREPSAQQRVQTWSSPIKDERGRWISSHVINQDIVAWVGQGRIADRTKENLRSSDVGISMLMAIADSKIFPPGLPFETRLR